MQHTYQMEVCICYTPYSNKFYPFFVAAYIRACMYVSIRSNADIIYIGWSKTKFVVCFGSGKELVRSNTLFFTEFCFLTHVQKGLVESKNVWTRPRSVELFCINLKLPFPHSFLLTDAVDVIL